MPRSLGLFIADGVEKLVGGAGFGGRAVFAGLKVEGSTAFYATHPTWFVNRASRLRF
jgi:hypothetical protein